jgi:predicted ABC-type ATPase
MRKQRKFEKLIIIIAGPNGAGKTTFSKPFLDTRAPGIRFLNADKFAQNFSPNAPDASALQAGKAMLEEMALLVSRGENFAFETTLSGRSYARHIPHWRSLGYRVELVFLILSSVEIAIARVKTRAEQRGHFIPEDVIRRRYDAGLRNLDEIYSPIVDGWAIYDNSDAEPVLTRTSHET